MSQHTDLFDPHMAATLVDILSTRARQPSDQVIYSFLLDGEEDEQHLTYQELDRRARTVAARLQSMGTAGDRVLLLYPPGLDYIVAFFGCLYAGMIAVPSFPPRLHRPDARLEAIVLSAQPSITLTTQAILAGLEQRVAQVPSLQQLHWVATDDLADADTQDWQAPEIHRDTLAFLQYTSGSTATPKGVKLTHGNLIHNLAGIARCFAASPESRGVIWLPPYHDMGLIGGILQPLYSGFPVTLLSPTAFLERPLRWLRAISRVGGTISGGPNFAYQLCMRKITAEDRETLDLSSWQVAFNGAEPIRAETLEAFTQTFASCGFRREAFYPCYGLAEATLLVSGGTQSEPPIIQRFAATALKHNHIQVASADDRDAQAFVSCGLSLPDQQMMIVDPETHIPCPPDRVGEIWISGPSVAQGYWNQEAETERTFGAQVAGLAEGPFLRTGDLGLLSDGQVFITGRLKDLILIRGRNYYPQDIELTVEKSHPALRAGGGAAFSVNVADQERLVIVQELERQARHANVEEVAAAIRKAVAEEHDLHIHAVSLIKPGSLPKTSSGKVQRHACRARFLDNQLEVIGQSVFGSEPEASAGERDSQHDGHVIREALKIVADPASRQALVTAYLQQQVSRLLSVAPAQLDPQQPLSAVGFDSLMAVEIKNQIETTFGVVLAVSTLLRGPSLTELAATILSEEPAPVLQPAAAEGTLAETAHYPLSSSQRALWLVYHLTPDSAAYCIPRALHLRGKLDVPALRRAFQGLIQRHPPLRTVFSAPEGVPIQEIVADAQVAFQELNATTWSEPLLRQRLSEEAQRPFDLEHGPVLRAYVFKRAPEEHILLITVHHIVMDFWSVIVFVRDLQALYEQEVTGVGSSLAPLPLQYRDFVRWQSDLLSGPRGEQLWTYWQQQLAGQLPMLELPTDRPRSTKTVHREAAYFFELPHPLSQRLQALGEAEGATLYMTLLAGFLVLLHRYTEQEDILIGSATAGRDRAQFMGLVGDFVNPVVIRAGVTGNLSFRALLRQVRQTVLSGFEHQDYPFIDLVDRLHPKRDPNRSPLFQIMFTFQQAPDREAEALTALALGQGGTRLSWGELTLESIPLEGHTVLFDLLLLMAEVNGQLTGGFQYDTSLFDATTIERMVEHFQTLLENIVAEPEQRLADLRLMQPAAYHQLLTEWNATQAEYPAERSIQQLFEAQVAQHPDRIALTYEDQQLTYTELNRRANQLAHYLRTCGVGLESAVGICLERSLDLVVGIIGVLKAGGFYVPMDPAYPSARLAYMLKDAQATVLLTQQRLVDRLGNTDARIVCLDSDWTVIEAEADTNPEHTSAPDTLAYMIYTSGSTGQPKGVMVTHRGLTNYLTWCQQAYPLEEGQGSPVHSSAAFDLTVTSMLAPLVSGQRVLLIAEGLGLEALAETLRRESNFSLVKLTPAHLQLLGAQLSSAPVADRTRAFIIGGENLLAEHVAFWQSAAPNTLLINEYGPTETVVGCSVYQIPAHQHSSPIIPIGRPIINTRLYILDRQLQPVPIGVPGQLYIGGAGVARGYFNRPDLTAERFIPDPFAQGISGEGGARLYASGDVARYLPDGNIECLGRIDHQVKVRGFRIELEEIDAVLSKHPAIRQAVVLVQGSNVEDRRLVAYIVAGQPSAPTAEELRSFLQEQIPPYMIPTDFVMLESIPLTPNGKIDREALQQIPPQSAAPALAGLSATDAAIGASRTDVEQSLIEMWQTLLRKEHVGIHDNFFDLGGHSFLVFQLQSQLKERFQCDIPTLEFLKLPTISTLATYITQAQAAQAPRAEVEQALIEMWQTLLRKEHVGIHDNFFDLGGHSFLVFQLQSQLKERFQCDIPTLEFLKLPTISTLATYITQAQAAQAEPAPEESQSRVEARLNAIQQRRQSRKNRK